MCKYGDLTPSDVTLREKIHFEGYMQMNPKYPTPWKEENDKIKAEKDAQKQADQGTSSREKLNGIEMTKNEDIEASPNVDFKDGKKNEGDLIEKREDADINEEGGKRQPNMLNTTTDNLKN